ncbi:hypothetical protein ACR4XK_12455, partial [Glaesserella parasuis]|uniref:hypothetical protein n=1 Tax=Glaesserella parasuis TaxID=738 RepID=UPI003F2FDD9E
TFTGHQRWIIATLYRSSGHWDVAREEFLKAYDAGYKNAFIMALTYDFKDAVTSCQLGREDLVKRYYDNLNELAENYPQENLNQIEQYKKNVVRIA